MHQRNIRIHLAHCPVPREKGRMRRTQPKTTPDYDIAIIGGGHNGLVCATYLARAGLKVVVLFPSREIGHEILSNFVRHIISIGVDCLPFVQDLEWHEPDRDGWRRRGD